MDWTCLNVVWLHKVCGIYVCRRWQVLQVLLGITNPKTCTSRPVFQPDWHAWLSRPWIIPAFDHLDIHHIVPRHVPLCLINHQKPNGIWLLLKNILLVLQQLSLNRLHRPFRQGHVVWLTLQLVYCSSNCHHRPHTGPHMDSLRRPKKVFILITGTIEATKKETIKGTMGTIETTMAKTAIISDRKSN